MKEFALKMDLDEVIENVKYELAKDDPNSTIVELTDISKNIYSQLLDKFKEMNYKVIGIITMMKDGNNMQSKLLAPKLLVPTEYKYTLHISRGVGHA